MVKSYGNMQLFSTIKNGFKIAFRSNDTALELTKIIKSFNNTASKFKNSRFVKNKYF